MFRKQLMIGVTTGLLIVGPALAQQPPPPPTDQGPTDPAPMDQDPMEQAPADPAPMDQDPMEQAPADPAPMDQDSTEQAPADPAPMDQDPTEQAPADPAPMDQDPMEQAPANESAGGRNFASPPTNIEPVPDGTGDDAMEMLRADGFEPISVKSDDETLGLYTITANSADGESVLVQIDVNEGRYWVYPVE